tara:strand:- start:91 stop:480 length:390 start_codon:yes stop_codon:yes gene_type:complete
MKLFILPVLAAFAFSTAVNSDHLKGPKELIVTSKSTKASIALAKYLKNNGVVKYSAYWCPNCLDQSELFGKEAYKELNVVECARDGKNSQTQLCIDKKIQGFPSWEINGKIIIGVQTLNYLAELTGFKY